MRGHHPALYTDAPAQDAQRLLCTVVREAQASGLKVHLAFHVDAHSWIEFRHYAAGTRQQAKDSALPPRFQRPRNPDWEDAVTVGFRQSINGG